MAAIVSCLANGGRIGDQQVVSPATIERCFEVQADGEDLVLGRDATFGIGYGLVNEATPLGINDRTLWWAGWGGSMAIVDVENQRTIVYAMNRMLPDEIGSLRAINVIFAAHGIPR